MSPLLITILRLSYLAILWAMVLIVVHVVRRDVFGATIKERRSRNTINAQKNLAKAVAKHDKAPGKNDEGGHRPRLVVTSGPITGASINLTGGVITFGRAPNCSLVIDDEYASSMHAKIYNRDGIFYLADMESTNGTFLDGQQVQGEVPIQMGQSIRIGRTVIELVR